MKDIVFTWQISNVYGWGVYGLHLALNWPGKALTGVQPGPLYLSTQDRRDKVSKILGNSQWLWEKMQDFAFNAAKIELPVFYALGNGFLRPRIIHDVALTGKINIAFPVFEDTGISPSEVKLLQEYDAVVTGSTWNDEVLKSHGIKTLLCFQGVDDTIFKPRMSKYDPDAPFRIFSGGKLEYRKGQDLVVEAFRIFNKNHPHSQLVTLWQSPWTGLAATMIFSRLGVPKYSDASGIDVESWVGNENVVDLGVVPNDELADYLNNIDVAVFPCRAEGGTNIVAMECMACGVPTIVSNNTGHRDLIKWGAQPLMRQDPVKPNGGFRGTDGWGESSVDEIVAALEVAYDMKKNGGVFVARKIVPWKDCIARVHSALASEFVHNE